MFEFECWCVIGFCGSSSFELSDLSAVELFELGALEFLDLSAF